MKVYLFPFSFPPFCTRRHLQRTELSSLQSITIKGWPSYFRLSKQLQYRLVDFT